MSEWQPIETAPKDGSVFLTCQNGEVYASRYSLEHHSRLTYRTHSLMVSSSHLYVDAVHEGETVKALFPIGEPWPRKFCHDWTIWQDGFDFKPTHWMPIPATPSQTTKAPSEDEALTD